MSYNNSFSFHVSILVYFASVKQIVSGGVFHPSVCAGVGGRCNPVQCFGAASKVCTIVCGWRKKKKESKKRRGKKRNSVPLCVEDPAGKRFCNYFSLPAKQAWFLWSAHTCTLDCLTLLTVYTSTYKSERVFMGCIWKRFESQQQRRVSAPDDESKRQTNPWILMRR